MTTSSTGPSSARPTLPADLRERFDLASEALIADPYPVFAELRERAPVFWNETSEQWVISHHADVHATLRDRRLGRAYHHRYSHAEFGRPEPDPRWAAFEESERWSLLNIEPPDHTRIRRLINKVFTPRAVAALAPMIHAEATGRIAELREQRDFDLIADYAQPYSVAVICSMLGVPRADTARLLGWSHAIVKMYELTTTDAERHAANAAAGEFVAYVRALIAERRRQPGSGLVADLVGAEDEGAVLSDDEILSTTIVLLNAGHEATVNTLGNGFRAFAHHPDQWHRIATGEVTARTAVEELVRWDTPVQLFERWVLDEGVEIAGQPMAVGEEIAMLFGAANRDPQQFGDPDRFDAGRGDASHVGFGGGIHFCIGAPLARLELEHSVAAIAELMPEFELVAEPSYHPTFVIRGLTELRVAATPAG